MCFCFFLLLLLMILLVFFLFVLRYPALSSLIEMMYICLLVCLYLSSSLLPISINSPKLVRTNWLFWLWNSWPFMKFYCLIKKKFVTMYMILALFIHESQIIDMNHRSKCVTSIRRMFSIGAVVKSTLFALRIARAWICKCTLMRFFVVVIKGCVLQVLLSCTVRFSTPPFTNSLALPCVCMCMRMLLLIDSIPYK